MHLFDLFNPAGATAKLACSARPDAPVVPWQPKSPRPHRVRRQAKTILRRSAERLAPVTE